MALIATGTNKEFKQVPEGSHMAVCIGVIDIGTQRWDYQGEPQIGRKVLIQWELHGEADDGTPLTMEDGRPLAVSKKYTLSLGKKANLRADLESWRGRAFTDDELAGFDITQLLGVPCMVTMKHVKSGEKTYANVASVTRFPAALKNSKPTPVNELRTFDVNDRDMQVYDSLPEWIAKQIAECVEWNAKTAQRPAQHQPATTGTGFDDMDDDIPF